MSEYEVRINRFRIAAAGNFSCYPKGASRRPYSAIFCFFPIGTTTDNFNYNQKNEDRTFSTTANVYPVSAFQTGNAPIFKHQHRTQFSYQPIKFCLLFFLSEFGIVSGKAQPGSPGMVMESRKAAPALRARLLRSYVPLRCVRAKVRPPALPHPFPAETFSTHKFKFQDCTEKNTIFLKNLLK